MKPGFVTALAAGHAQHRHGATRHVLAAVVARAFHHRTGA